MVEKSRNISLIKILFAAIIVMALIIFATQAIGAFKASKCTEKTTATIMSVNNYGIVPIRLDSGAVFSYNCSYTVEGRNYNGSECSSALTTINTLLTSGLPQDIYFANDLHIHINKIGQIRYQDERLKQNNALVGQTVNILYNPDNPSDFIFDQQNSVSNLEIWIIAGAVVCVLIFLLIKDGIIVFH